jgi:hypothetical protein
VKVTETKTRIRAHTRQALCGVCTSRPPLARAGLAGHGAAWSACGLACTATQRGAGPRGQVARATGRALQKRPAGQRSASARAGEQAAAAGLRGRACRGAGRPWRGLAAWAGEPSGSTPRPHAMLACIYSPLRAPAHGLARRSAPPLCTAPPAARWTRRSLCAPVPVAGCRPDASPTRLLLLLLLLLCVCSTAPAAPGRRRLRLPAPPAPQPVLVTSPGLSNTPPPARRPTHSAPTPQWQQTRSSP